jgi:hypothetical protein
MQRLDRILFVLLIGIFLVLFWLRGGVLLDTDFGWHVRMGQIILRNGIPPMDVLSYTMPHFPMVDHEWLTNIILASVFPLIGFRWLAGIFAFLALVSLLLQIFRLRISDIRRNYWFLTMLLLSGLSLYSFVGVRPQVLTWFLFSVFVVVLLQKRWQRLFWILPLVQLLWVNLHGGFAVGVFLAGLIFLLESFRRRKFAMQLFVLFCLCVLASWLNPYGIRIWGEILLQLSDGSLRMNITEWQPAIYFFNLAFWIYVLLSVFLVSRYWKVLVKERFVQLGCFVVFLIMALSSMRHIPLWLIVSVSVTEEGFTLLVKEVCARPFGRERFEKAISVFFGLLLLILLPQGWSMFQTLHSYSSAVVYPVGAASYLRLHHQPKRVFSLYDWNSFLLWQLPGTKVFIDGMMPSWRWHYKGQNESDYAFVEYQEVLQGKISLRSEIDKYKVDAVILPLDAASWDDAKKDYSISGLERQVKMMGWKRVYIDETAVIYRL